MDSAPCSPIMPAPMCQRRIQGSEKVITAWTLDCASALNLLATAFTTNHVPHEFHRLTQGIVTHRAKQCWRYAAHVCSICVIVHQCRWHGGSKVFNCHNRASTSGRTTMILGSSCFRSYCLKVLTNLIEEREDQSHIWCRYCKR